jgi:hypothetical protein
VQRVPIRAAHGSDQRALTVTDDLTPRDRAAVAAMRAWLKENGRPPTAREWDRLSGDHPSYRQIAATIGWKRARELAGATSSSTGPHGVTWTQDAIVQALRDWHGVHGQWPTSKEWEKTAPGRPATSTVVKAIGWRRAVELAGHSAAGRRATR